MFIKAHSKAFLVMERNNLVSPSSTAMIKETINCTDENCPSHGSLKTRGQVFDGIVIADKMSKTVTVEWPFLRYLHKYQRYLKKRTHVKAHNPPCLSVKTGDSVRIVECRPISKTVKFVVMEKLSGDKK